MNCNRCGQVLSKLNRVCPNCGYIIPKDATSGSTGVIQGEFKEDIKTDNNPENSKRLENKFAKIFPIMMLFFIITSLLEFLPLGESKGIIFSVFLMPILIIFFLYKFRNVNSKNSNFFNKINQDNKLQNEKLQNIIRQIFPKETFGEKSNSESVQAEIAKKFIKIFIILPIIFFFVISFLMFIIPLIISAINK